MRVVKMPEFITRQEQRELVGFYLARIDAPNTFSIDDEGKVSTVKGAVKPAVILSVVDKPPLLEQIHDRIRSAFDLSDYRMERKMGCDGTFVLILPPGGGMGPHYDARDEIVAKDEEVIRFNILLESAEVGGVVSVKSGESFVEIDPKERELHVYNVTDNLHQVSQVKGSKHRVMCLFSVIAPLGTAETIMAKSKFEEVCL